MLQYPCITLIIWGCCGLLNSIVTKENIAYMGHPRPNRVKSVTLCHLTAMSGHRKQKGKHNKEKKRQKSKTNHSQVRGWGICGWIIGFAYFYMFQSLFGRCILLYLSQFVRAIWQFNGLSYIQHLHCVLCVCQNSCYKEKASIRHPNLTQ